MKRAVASLGAVHYPSSDGNPMADSDVQRNAIIYGIGALQVCFGKRRDVYVSGDLLMYYEEGNPRASVAPDVFVVFGVEDREREIYKLWEEGEVPAFVLEVASRNTWREDSGPKRGLYARLGVREYWQYDPSGRYLSPQLQGFRLAGEVYERWPAAESMDGTLTLRSETLGLDLRVKGTHMRFHDPATGQDLPTYREVHAAREAAAAQAEQEVAARRAAEARVAELEALLREVRR